MQKFSWVKDFFPKVGLFLFLCVFFIALAGAQETQEEYETIGSGDCVSCHEKSKKDTVITEDISGSIHDGLSCQECHLKKDTVPHKEIEGLNIGLQGCDACHEDAAEEYKMHGHLSREDNGELPSCADCHGYHHILHSSDEQSKTHPANLPVTCGVCHKNLDLIEKHEIRTDHPVEVYDFSIHGTSVQEGVFAAATCNDCHSSGGTAHKIYSAPNPESSVNHFNIPETCGKCHTEITKEFNEGIHGELVIKGDSGSPVCTHCHGEHGILSPTDPRSPVSRARLAEATCTPCHESISLTEKYGISSGRRPKFIDNYHGLKTKSGDLFVANCASCHGFHMILPSSDPNSSIHPDNLQETCGECHPGMAAELAATPIHGISETGEKLESKVVKVVRVVYIIAIIVVIGLMAVHWLIDLFRQIVLVIKKPSVRRMLRNEVWQHTLLMVSFIVLVITGFALRYGDSWMAKLLFGWDHGFLVRGIIHRVAAVILTITTIWHFFYLFTKRGKQYLKDMLPKFSDFKHFFQRIMFNLGLSKTSPEFKRFSYIEKAEYWALIWGNAVMIITGFLLWFDNKFVHILPKGSLEVALVIHFYEAILASLAILIWHMYATIFNPHVYPMNPSWLTGKMPKDMFKHEHGDVKIEDVEE